MSNNSKRLVISEAETAAFAADFAAQLKNGDIVCLEGTLGAGKSFFARALIRSHFHSPHMDVPSPTFTLVQRYGADEGDILPIWHFDLYRLSSPEEVYETGWEDALSEGVVLVEWPEKLEGLLPVRRYDVRLSFVEGEPNHRDIEVIYHDA